MNTINLESKQCSRGYLTGIETKPMNLKETDQNVGVGEIKVECNFEDKFHHILPNTEIGEVSSVKKTYSTVYIL